MTQDLTTLDAHEQPSERLRGIWKAISKSNQEDLLRSPDIDDPRSPEFLAQLRLAGSIPAGRISAASAHIADRSASSAADIPDAPIYYHPMLPGLLIIPNLLTPSIQRRLLNCALHRDLTNPSHKTNLHPHYSIPYPNPPGSLFTYPPTSPTLFQPLDPTVHKPLSIKQVLDRRLHWLTLGGQYDWTNRVYPGERPPAFPPDLEAFLRVLFPETVAQAAIVNFYSPGDTMMMHRDVSERTDRGLISLSMGCDGLFMITPNNLAKQEEPGEQDEGKKPYLLLRIRSGDAIYMTGEARYAWHGVPKVLKGTCPEYLEDWPAEGEDYKEWKGWIRNKRINLNVRQMEE
ncbi:hypothetical protein VUR80DRAFT_2410 [Thermomyces stellatus]